MPEKRENGFYWLRYMRDLRAPIVAQWTDGSWQFVGSLHFLDDDELAAEGLEVVSRACLVCDWQHA